MTPSSQIDNFQSVISAIQKISQFSLDAKKRPIAKKIDFLESLINRLRSPDALSFSSLLELEKTEEMIRWMLERIQQNPASLPHGPVVTFISEHSSFFSLCKNILPAVIHGNPILTHSTTYNLVFEKFRSLLLELLLPTENLQNIITNDETLFEIIYTHPALKAVHIEGYEYETQPLKKFLQQDDKLYKLSFGSRNPVVFLHDSTVNDFSKLLVNAIDPLFFKSTRHNRWFVQEKIYDTFKQNLQTAIDQYPLMQVQSNENETAFQVKFKQQWLQLKKESPQWTQRMENTATPLTYHLDFNNCSPWQQQELLGPTLTLTRFKTISEVIKFANTTHYADTASVFSSDLEKANSVAQQLFMPQISLNSIYARDYLKPHKTIYKTGNNNTQTDFDFMSMRN